MLKYTKSRRGPKKKVTKTHDPKVNHVSTFKILQERKNEQNDTFKALVGESYNPKSYYRMVERLIARANKAGENIPPWFPYPLRQNFP